MQNGALIQRYSAFNFPALVSDAIFNLVE